MNLPRSSPTASTLRSGRGPGLYSASAIARPARRATCPRSPGAARASDDPYRRVTAAGSGRGTVPPDSGRTCGQGRGAPSPTRLNEGEDTMTLALKDVPREEPSPQSAVGTVPTVSPARSAQSDDVTRLDAFADVVQSQARVARAEASLAKAQR